MSDDGDSLLEIGGSDLAQHYPDRGLLLSSNWYNAILSVETEARGLLGWWASLGSNSFGAVLSADPGGLRVTVPGEQFAAFIPWPAATVSAARGSPATVVRLRAAAVPSLTLVFHLDDTAADDLFRGVIPPLPQRTPPRRLLRLRPWAAGGLVLVLLTAGGYLASLNLSGVAWFSAVVVAAVVVWLGLVSLKPFIEERS
jgi:hypothetical protein